MTNNQVCAFWTQLDVLNLPDTLVAALNILINISISAFIISRLKKLHSDKLNNQISANNKILKQSKIAHWLMLLFEATYTAAIGLGISIFVIIRTTEWGQDPNIITVIQAKIKPYSATYILVQHAYIYILNGIYALVGYIYFEVYTNIKLVSTSASDSNSNSNTSQLIPASELSADNILSIQMQRQLRPIRWTYFLIGLLHLACYVTMLVLTIMSPECAKSQQMRIKHLVNDSLTFIVGILAMIFAVLFYLRLCKEADLNASVRKKESLKILLLLISVLSRVFVNTLNSSEIPFLDGLRQLDGHGLDQDYKFAIAIFFVNFMIDVLPIVIFYRIFRPDMDCENGDDDDEAQRIRKQSADKATHSSSLRSY